MDRIIPNVIFEAPKVHVFSLPPSDFLKSAAWEGNYIWSGQLKFVREGSKFFVRLYEKGDANQLFGECPVRDGSSGSAKPGSEGASSASDGGSTESVQPASDSTRAFVLRVEDGDKFSYVGLMFDDRAVAYNFSSSLIHRKKGMGAAPILPVQDHTLDDNEAVTIDLFNKVKLSKQMDGAVGSPALGSASASSSHLLQSKPGEMPRVALDRLPVSTAGKSRRVKMADGGSASSSPTADAPAMERSPLTAASSGSKIDDIFAADSKPQASLQPQTNATASRGGATIDDVFGGPAPAAAAPQSKAQKDVLDTLFG